MKLRYTVTTLTKRCPYCGEILDEETHGELTPILAVFCFITIPIIIPYLLIKYLGFGDPDIPPVGPKTTTCPKCHRQLHTNNLSVEELNAKELLNYRFSVWFFTSYALGAIFCFGMLYLLIDSVSFPSWLGIVSILSLVGAIAIVITYRVMLANCLPKKRTTSLLKKLFTARPPKKEKKDETDSCIYCRRCGKRLSSDSRFCDKCGTEVFIK